VLAFGWFASKEAAYRDLAAPAPALVAARHIPSGTRLAPGMLEIREIPRAFIQPGALRSADEADGQIAVAPIAAGEQVLANKITRGGVALALAVPPGKRAVSVGVDAAGGVAGLLQPGDLVDVIASTDDGGSPRTWMLLQAAPVLAVGKAFAAGKERDGDGGFLDAPADTVTVAATPLEAAHLAHLELAGRVKLVLRAPGDAEKIPLPPLSGRAPRPAGGGDDPVRRR
jgi:pilus assembly protein CpaB